MTLRFAWLTMVLVWCLIAAVALVGCNATTRPDNSGDGAGGSTKTVVSGNTINNTGPCSMTIIINNLEQTVKGDRGATITVGNTVITFAPDCSTATVTTLPEAAPL
jgi:hypothetical protein